MEHNTKIIAALVLTFVAGYLFGHGIGAEDQYDEIEGFLVRTASHDQIFMIEGKGYYTIEKTNLTNMTGFVITDEFENTTLRHYR